MALIPLMSMYFDDLSLYKGEVYIQRSPNQLPNIQPITADQLPKLQPITVNQISLNISTYYKIYMEYIMLIFWGSENKMKVYYKIQTYSAISEGWRVAALSQHQLGLIELPNWVFFKSQQDYTRTIQRKLGSISSIIRYNGVSKSFFIPSSNHPHFLANVCVIQCTMKRAGPHMPEKKRIRHP
ncbi:hypothetical protein Hanom_Chr16g01452061 [Helianthus anomalus]